VARVLCERQKEKRKKRFVLHKFLTLCQNPRGTNVASHPDAVHSTDGHRKDFFQGAQQRIFPEVAKKIFPSEGDKSEEVSFFSLEGKKTNLFS